MQEKRDLPPCHPAALIFPLMDEGALNALAESIRANGQLHPVVMFGGRILDGRNRWLACSIAGVQPKTTVYAGDAPTQFAYEMNATRRHLTPIQRAAAATEIVPLLAEEAKERQQLAGAHGEKGGRGNKTLGDGSSPGVSRDESARSTAKAAKMTGAGVGSVKAMVTVKREAPEVFDLVKQGTVKTVSDAKKIAKLEPAKRSDVVEMVKAGADPCEALETIKAQSPDPGPTQEDRLAKIARLLKESAPIAEKLNDKLSQVHTLIERAGVRAIGGVGSLRIGYELTLVAQTISQIADALGGAQ